MTWGGQRAIKNSVFISMMQTTHVRPKTAFRCQIWIVNLFAVAVMLEKNQCCNDQTCGHRSGQPVVFGPKLLVRAALHRVHSVAYL